MGQLIRMSLLASTLAVVFPQANSVPASPPVTDAESYLVYGVLLPKEMPGLRGAAPKTLLVQQETQTLSRCLPSGNPLQAEWREAFSAYKTTNAVVRTLLPNDSRMPAYVLAPADQIRTSFSGTKDVFLMWTRFHEKYPGYSGYIEVSAVGFDASKSRAIVYTAHHCGGMCGGGAYHLMQKMEFSWWEVRVPGVSLCEWAS